MIKLEELSNKELKKMAKDRNIADFHNMPKPELIKRIHLVDSQLLEKQDSLVQSYADEIQSNAPLSFKALQWQNYFNRVKITPEVFLQRFPEHVDKQYIMELIKKETPIVVIPTETEPQQEEGNDNEIESN